MPALNMAKVSIRPGLILTVYVKGTYESLMRFFKVKYTKKRGRPFSQSLFKIGKRTGNCTAIDNRRARVRSALWGSNAEFSINIPEHLVSRYVKWGRQMGGFL